MSYNIAVASSDGKQINLHFGHAGAFYVLQVEEDSGAWKTIGKKEIPPSPACSTQESCSNGCGGSRHENMMVRIKTITDLLEGCRYLLTAKIGPKPSDLLRHSGITALESPPDIGEAIIKLNKYHLKYAKLNR
jgi:predicted Fe-Mo cluster-binding NifX family protein